MHLLRGRNARRGAGRGKMKRADHIQLTTTDRRNHKGGRHRKRGTERGWQRSLIISLDSASAQAPTIERETPHPKAETGIREKA